MACITSSHIPLAKNHLYELYLNKTDIFLNVESKFGECDVMKAKRAIQEERRE